MYILISWGIIVMLFLCKKVALFLENTGGVYSLCECVYMYILCTCVCTCYVLHVCCVYVCQWVCLCACVFVCSIWCVYVTCMYLDGVGKIGRQWERRSQLHMFLYDCSTSRAIFNFSLAFKMFLNKYLRNEKRDVLQEKNHLKGGSGPH